MKLEDQTSNLQLSGRLEDLGITVPSHFAWQYMKDDDTGPVYELGPKEEALGGTINAYTVAELGQMLPETNIYKDEDGWNAETNHGMESFEIAETMADVCTQMLIWLLENGHVTAEEINEAAK